MEYLGRYRALAAERGGELLSQRYIGCRYKHEWRCAEGHEWAALPSNVKKGTWCPKCRMKGSGAKRTADNLARGRAAAEARGGKCLATENGPSARKVQWECAEGHRWEATNGNVILHGTWCPTCFNERKGEPTIADNLTAARRIAAGHGGDCLEDQNFSIHDHVRWICAEGHEWDAVFYSVRRGRWCKLCAGAKRSATMVHDNLPRARRIANKRGGECLAEENFPVSAKISWRCEEGHEWAAQFNNVANGSWCPRCRNKSESYCHQVLEALFPRSGFERNVRSLAWLGTGLGGQSLELDIYSADLRLALGFNGFLHDGPVEAYGGAGHHARIVEHDRRKAEACAEEGVCLIVVSFADVSRNRRQADPRLVAEAIWRAVADLGYAPGIHLPTKEDLLAALGL